MRTLFLLNAILLASANEVFLDYLLTQANFSVSPCQNFYRHVCPLKQEQETGKFRSLPSPEEEISVTPADLEARWKSHPGLRLKHVAIVNDIFGALLSMAPLSESKKIEPGNDSEEFASSLLDTAEWLLRIIPDKQMLFTTHLELLTNLSSVDIDGYYQQTIPLDKQILEEVIRRAQNALWAKENTIGEYIADLIESTFIIPPTKPGSIVFNLTELERIYDTVTETMESSTLAEEESFGDVSFDRRVASAREFGKFIISLRKSDPAILYSLFSTMKVNAFNGHGKKRLFHYVIMTLPLLSKIFNSGFPARMQDSYYNSVMGHERMHSFIRDWGNLLTPRHFATYRNCLIENTERVCAKFQEKECGSGKFTFTEDAPDVEGARIAYQLYLNTFQQELPTKKDHKMYFYAQGIYECMIFDRQHRKNDDNVTWNPHSAAYVRVNTVMQQMPEFADAFGCSAGDPMVLPKESICQYFPTEEQSSDEE